MFGFFKHVRNTVDHVGKRLIKKKKWKRIDFDYAFAKNRSRSTAAAAAGPETKREVPREKGGPVPRVPVSPSPRSRLALAAIPSPPRRVPVSPSPRSRDGPPGSETRRITGKHAAVVRRLRTVVGDEDVFFRGAHGAGKSSPAIETQLLLLSGPTERRVVSLVVRPQ